MKKKSSPVTKTIVETAKGMKKIGLIFESMVSILFTKLVPLVEIP
jgi:hypothetical protein